MANDARMGGIAFPRPGRALTGLLVAIGVVGVINGLAATHTGQGGLIPLWLSCIPSAIAHGQVWRLATAGLLTTGFFQLFASLLGLYFFSTDLERRWGSARYLRFVGASIVFAYALTFLVDLLLPFGGPLFHPAVVFGPEPAIIALVLAWTMQNPGAQIRLFFFLPLTGTVLFWITIVFALAGLVFPELLSTEGAIAPFGGVLAALTLSGFSSPLRTLYLKAKLAFLKSKSGNLSGPGSGLGRGAGRPSASSPRPVGSGKISRSGGPPLRVVYGGLLDDAKDAKPKDRRDLH